jgi:hypothetical protein
MFNPFNINDDKDYLIWRDKKLENYPQGLENLLVEINDPRKLSADEFKAMHQICQKTNMVVYAGTVLGEDKEIPRLIGEQFGLVKINHNWLADEDAITSLTVNDEGSHPQYIPYTNRLIKWHTDGYYNKADEQIWGLLLHCVQPAKEGGENQLMDHEIAYIKMRDENPDFIRALMSSDAMTIPPRLNDDGSVERAEESGPLFSVSEKTGDLHMRYTARTRSIAWKDGELVKQAVSFLEQLLDSDSPYIFRGTLQPGMGLVSNNVLHDRSGFTDDENSQRLLYRARYFDRIKDTGIGC